MNSIQHSNGSQTRSMTAINEFINGVENLSRESDHPEPMEQSASIYLASVLEYLISEIFELAGKMTHQSNRKRITPRDITLAIKNDPELEILCADVTIPESGVRPFIHEVLVKRNTRRSKRHVTFSEMNIEYPLSDIDIDME